MKIVIIGNSVALRVRPPKGHPNNLNYTYHLRKRRPADQIVNTAIGALTVLDITSNIDKYINEFGDWYILNLGVVEACSREAPLWLFRVATSNRQDVIAQVSRLLYGGVFAKYRNFFTRLRMKRSWVNRRTFHKHFDLLMRLILKETNARVIVLGINLANDRIEAMLPESKQKILAYNAILREVTLLREQIFIDLSDLTADVSYPDGVHFNDIGHEDVAERIDDYLSTYENNN